MRKFLLLFLLVAAGSSCNNDLDIDAPYRDMPIVYCILNPADSIHYLRLEKSFSGNANAYDMAAQPDSIYYPDAQVVLERWNNNEIKESYSMLREELPSRDPGIFVNEPNYLYSLHALLQANSEYRLHLTIPATGTEVTARTHLVDKFRIIKPEDYKKNFSFSAYDNYQAIEWVTAKYTRVYHVLIRFHYLEIEHGDTTFLYADWNLANYAAENDAGGISMEAKVLHRNFYKWLGNKLKPIPKSIVRLANRKSIDFMFTVGGDELYTYIEIYKPDDGPPTEKPVYTNIANGIGLFSSRFEQAISGKSLSFHSIDSLSHGIYTKHLGFDDSRNEYYN